MHEFTSKFPITLRRKGLDHFFDTRNIKDNIHTVTVVVRCPNEKRFFVQHFSDNRDGFVSSPQSERFEIARCERGYLLGGFLVYSVGDPMRIATITHSHIVVDDHGSFVFAASEYQSDIRFAAKLVPSFHGVLSNGGIANTIVKLRFFRSDYPIIRLYIFDKVFPKCVVITMQSSVIGFISATNLKELKFFFIREVGSVLILCCRACSNYHHHRGDQQKTHCVLLPKQSQNIQNHETIPQSIYIYMVALWVAALSFLLSVSNHIQAHSRLLVCEMIFSKFRTGLI